MDAASVLSLYVFLLLVIPSDRGVGPLGAAGSPAGIYGLGMMLWWIWHHVRHRESHRGNRIRPVRLALMVFVLCILIAYAQAGLSALPGEDAKGTNMALISIASHAGVLLVAHDGIADRERFLALIRRIAVMGGLYACLGLVQFFTGQNFVDAIQIPGLVSSGSGGVDVRGGFLRPQATARHPLEYAAVLSMILPLALSLSLVPSRWSIVRRAWPAALVAVAAVVSMTRSALLGIVVGVGILVPTWDRKTRRAALLLGAAALVAMYFLVPGLVGTILGMFAPGDPSLASRTDSYDAFWSYFSIHPVFGRGLGSMSASYHIFDNQYLDLLIEIGVVGTAAFCLLVLVSAVTSFRARRVERIGKLGPALGSSVIAGALLCGSFDAFAFPQAVGMLFLCLGLCGSIGNFAAPPASGAGPVAVAEPPHRSWAQIVARRWYVFLPVLLLSASPVPSWTRTATGVYYTKVTVEFQAPPAATKNNPLRTEAWSLVGYAAMVQRLYSDEYAPAPVRPNTAPLFGADLTDSESVSLRNDGGQWQTNFDAPLIDVEVVAGDPSTVRERASATTAELIRLAGSTQDCLGIWRQAQITAVQRPTQATVTYVAPRLRSAWIGWGAASLGLAFGSSALLDRSMFVGRERRLRREGRGRPPEKDRRTKSAVYEANQVRDGERLMVIDHSRVQDSPVITAVLYADRTGELTIDARKESFYEASPSALREALMQRVIGVAASLGRPVRMTAMDESGSAVLIVSPDGEAEPADDSWSRGEDRGEPLRVLDFETTVREDRRSFLTQEVVEEPSTVGWRGFLTGIGIRMGPGKAERSERADIQAVSQHWPGPRTIAVVNGRGGVGKSMTTICLSATFARYGGAGVLAEDNNQTRGTLGWRTEKGPHDASLLELLPQVGRLLSPGAQAADLARYVHHQTRDKYDVLRSRPELLAEQQRFDADTVDAVQAVATKYYRLILIDSGNDESDAMWLRMIHHANQIVVPTTTRRDSAESAALLLDALYERGGHYASLALNAVVIVSQENPTVPDRIVEEIAAGFKSIARAVVKIPFDPAMKDGLLAYGSLMPKTRRAWLAAAATVARGL